MRPKLLNLALNCGRISRTAEPIDCKGQELRSTVTADGALRLHLEPVAVPEPGPGQLLVRAEGGDGI